MPSLPNQARRTTSAHGHRIRQVPAPAAKPSKAELKGPPQTVVDIASTLADPTRSFVRLPGPASAEALEALMHQAPMELPPRYLQLLAATDGPEGDLGIVRRLGDWATPRW